MMLTPTYLTTNQKTLHGLTTPSLNHYYKTFQYPLQVRTHSFCEARAHSAPPFPGKVIKLSFSMSPKILSLKFHLALVYREAELSTSEMNLIAALFLGLINISKSQKDLFQCYLADEVVY